MSPPVQAGPVCAACPGIQADLALVKGRQEMVMKNQEEMKGSLQDIYNLLRAQNGEVEATDKEVAVRTCRSRRGPRCGGGSTVCSCPVKVSKYLCF